MVIKSKGFKLDKEDLKFVNTFFKDRDKEKYPKEPEYLLHVIKKYIEYKTGINVELTDLVEELKGICPDGELQYIDDKFICNRGGYYERGGNRKNPRVLGVGKVPFNKHEVKYYCRDCMSNIKARIDNDLWRVEIKAGVRPIKPCQPNKDGSMSKP